MCIKRVCSPCVCEVHETVIGDCEMEKMRERRHAALEGGKTGGGVRDVNGLRVYLQDIPWPRVKHRGHPRTLVFGVGGGAVVPGRTQKTTKKREVGERPAKTNIKACWSCPPSVAWKCQAPPRMRCWWWGRVENESCFISIPPNFLWNV